MGLSPVHGQLKRHARGDAHATKIGATLTAVQSFSHYPAIPGPPFIRHALRVLPEHPCSYFPDRVARSRAFYAEELSPQQYHELMDAGFRRSGRVVYQPVCSGCRDCVSIRVPVETFSPSKSQRRCWRRNQDLIVSADEAIADVEAFDLYTRYLRDWHGGDSLNGADRESFEAFLYDSPVKTMQMRYRDTAGRLLAVGLCDWCDQRSLSSVYFFHDPAQSKRGLGTFGALMEIELARRMGIAHYYLGYWIADCSTMSYKSSFRRANCSVGTACGDAWINNQAWAQPLAGGSGTQ